MSEYELDFKPSSSLRPEHKAKWLTALRSGDYKQGQLVLRNNQNEYCCLGVLCDVLKDEIGGYWELIDRSYAFKVTSDEATYDTAGLLPVVAGLTGMGSLGQFSPSTKRAMNASPSRATDHNSLSSLNDSSGMTFAEIADVIEKYF